MLRNSGGTSSPGPAIFQADRAKIQLPFSDTPTGRSRQPSCHYCRKKLRLLRRSHIPGIPPIRQYRRPRCLESCHATACGPSPIRCEPPHGHPVHTSPPGQGPSSYSLALRTCAQGTKHRHDRRARYFCRGRTLSPRKSN